MILICIHINDHRDQSECAKHLGVLYYCYDSKKKICPSAVATGHHRHRRRQFSNSILCNTYLFGCMIYQCKIYK